MKRLGLTITCCGLALLLSACSTTGPAVHTADRTDDPRSATDNAPAPGTSTSPPGKILEASYRKSPHGNTVFDLPEATDYSPRHDWPLVDELDIAPEWTRTPEDRARSLPAPPAPPAEETSPIKKDLQPRVDDLSRASLKRAIQRQLRLLEPSDPARRVRLGNRKVSQGHLVETLQAFKKLLGENLSREEFDRRLNEEFEVIEAGYRRPGRPVLFTGYYTPIIPASRKREGAYIYPLYQKPEWYPEARSSGSAGAIIPVNAPYSGSRPAQSALLTRKDIDGGHALEHQHLELAWLKDDLERYFLHIQGSGFLRFPDGSLQSVQYMGSNHLPYRSVGKQMIDDGVIHPAQGSMQGMKQYFREHPEDINKYLFRNRRYIFFRMSDRSPQGSGGAELVAGRSIATDKSLYPAGGLAYITVHKPILNEQLEITGWKKISRFVVDQDTGAAIKGPGRVDLYFGVGDAAGAAAGHYKRTGSMVYLLKK